MRRRWARPKPAVDLKPGTQKYQVMVAMGPQQMKMSLTTTIKEENGALVGGRHDGDAHGNRE